MLRPGAWVIWTVVALVGLYALSHRWTVGGMAAAMILVAVVLTVGWMVQGFLTRNRPGSGVDQWR